MELHITEYAKECGVSRQTVYNNKAKFGLTIKNIYGVSYVVIDKNAKIFKELKLKQAELLRSER